MSPSQPRATSGTGRLRPGLDLLRPHLEEGVPLTCAAAEAGIPLRTAQRWLARYREDGPAGLGRGVRRDAGERRFPADLVALIEGMGLK